MAHPSLSLAPVIACAIGFAAAFDGCALRAPRFSVTGWAPRERRIDDPRGIGIWVEFSGRPDRASVERSFRLAKDGAAVEGKFYWTGSRIGFVPSEGFERNRGYEVAIGADAEDERGVSLDEELRFAFTTRAEDGRPTILSVHPREGESVLDPYAPIEMAFSEPVDRASLYGAFSLRPQVRGRFDWSDGDSRCAFAPLDPYGWQTEYEVGIRTGLSDLSGNSLAEAFASRFTVGEEGSPPSVLRLSNAVDGRDGELVLGSALAPGWESTWGLCLTFSRPVRREGLEGRILIEPAWDYSIEDASSLGSSFILEPRERLERNVLYSVTIRAGIEDGQGRASEEESVFSLLVDGPRTASPLVDRLRFRCNPASTAIEANYDDKRCDHSQDYSAISLDISSFPVGLAVETYIDLYFALATGASIDLYSLMRRFSVESTNSCASFLPLRMQLSDFAEPQPLVLPGLACARIGLRVVNASESGIVRFGIDGELVDSAGNPMSDDWSLSLLK